MFQFDFISARGGVLPLANNENFILKDVTGITQLSVALSTNSTPTMDGDSVNHTQGQPRPITLFLEVRAGKNVEAVKRYILSFFKPKLEGVLHWVMDGRDIELKGIVEQAEMPRFTDNAVMQISLYCSQPYWEDVNYIVTRIKLIKDLHYFPEDKGGLALPVEGVAFGVYDTNRKTTYTNDGDVSIGVTISIIATATVTNPIIYNLTTGEFIGVNTTMNPADEIIISTHKGAKTITKNGENIIDLIKDGSTFIQIEVGDNEFQIDCEEDEQSNNVYFTLNFKQRYI